VQAVGGALEHLSFQTAAAKRELLVLLHELAQGNFKRFGASMMVLGEQTGAAGLIFSGVGLAVIALIGVIGGLSVAAVKGAHDSAQLQNALLATGDFAGKTEGQIRQMKVELAAATNTTVGSAREIMQGLVASGRFSATSIDTIGQAALLMAARTGQSEEQVVKHFDRMADGVTQWAFKTNEQYHFLSLAQYKHIKALEDQGKQQDAMRATGEALITHFQAQRSELGYIETALKKGKQLWSEWWDAAWNIGRPESLEERLARLQKTLTDRGARGPLNDLTGAAFAKGNANLRSEIGIAQSDVIQNRRLASNASAQEEASAAADQGAARCGQEARGDPDRTAQNYLANLEKQYRATTHEARVYDDTLAHLKANADKFTLTEGYQALYLAEQIDKQKDKNRVDAEAIKYLGQISAMREQEAAAIASQNTADRQQLQDRQFEISLIGKTAEEIARLTAAYEINKQKKLRYIETLDASQRGALTPDEVQQRLNDIDANANAQLAAQNDQLTEKFKPGWKKLLDGWTNTTQLMVDAHNGAMMQIVQGGEDMFAQWVKTGKLSARSLVDGILDEWARLFYRKNIAGPLANFGNSFLQQIGLGSPFGMSMGQSVWGGVPAGQSFFDLSSIGNMGADFVLGGAHSGAIVGREATFTRAMSASDYRSAFAGAPKFHTGGIAGDEVPIIAKKGEGIFTQEQMKALAPAGAQNSITYAPVIQIDARTDRAEVEQLVTKAVRAGQADLMDKLNRGSL
jgi:phage-related minor tail protein